MGRRLSRHFLPTGKELLEIRRLLLLILAVVGIIIIERAPEEIVLGQSLIDSTLLLVVVEFATILTQKEEKMNLTVIIGQCALRRVDDETSEGTEDKRPEAPLDISTGDVLIPQTVDDGEIDAEEPHVACKAIEHTSDKRLLSRDTRHLTIGRVAEVGQHQQHDTTDVRPEIGIMEHPTSSGTKKDRNNSDDIRVNVELIPQQSKCQSDRTRKVYIEPLLCVL